MYGDVVEAKDIADDAAGVGNLSNREEVAEKLQILQVQALGYIAHSLSEILVTLKSMEETYRGRY